MNADWTDKPVILSAHETGKDEFTVTWEGKAPVYIVKVDGLEKTVVADKQATIKLENGLHTIQIIPINRETKRDDIQNITGAITIKSTINFNLDMYHMKREHLVAGLFSDEIKIMYSAEEIYDIVPTDLTASVDLAGAVHFSFKDSFGADGYLISYKTDNEEHAIAYLKSDVDAAKWITADGNNVRIIIAPEFLKIRDYPVIQPDKDYIISVELQKRSMDYISTEETNKLLLSSRKASINIKTTPVWKEAPVITFSEQTADGEITIRWNHPAVDLGCKYIVSLRNKAIFITTDESELVKVDGAEAIIRNMQNGSYTLFVTPENNGNQGTSSKEFTVIVNNNWSQAPVVTLTQMDSRTVKATITHVLGINSYSIKVSCGNAANLLSFVDLDYSLYGEYIVAASAPITEFTFMYEKESKETDEIKVRFEIYGIHNCDDGTMQYSAMKIEQITLKP